MQPEVINTLISVGKPSFRKIIEGNYLYADKTEYIYRLLSGYDSCFLSRPRRFGKTLLLDTIQELFQGNDTLFDGLWIKTSSDYEFEKRPVLRFSMTYGGINDVTDLSDRIKRDIQAFAKELNIKIHKYSCGEMLSRLLKKIYKKFGTEAVVLVDEYDAPIIWYLSNPELIEINRFVLHDFYTSLKQSYMHVHFSLVTGITRFTMTALDSGPNDIEDITMEPEFAGICGFTVSDLDNLFDRSDGNKTGQSFKRIIDKTLQNLKNNGMIGIDADSEELKTKIKEWYDGYSWLGSDRVLNPYSFLNFFKKSYFRPYWMSLPLPLHLAHLVKDNPLAFIQPKMDDFPAQAISEVGLSTLAPAPLLFHSGYLTIGSLTVNTETVNGTTVSNEIVSFRFPNLEVAKNYKSLLFQQAFSLADRQYFNKFSQNLPKALLNRDSLEIADLISNLLATIPSNIHNSTEKHYHTTIHGAFAGAGLIVHSEESTAHGRPDITLHLKNSIHVVIELKYCKSDDEDVSDTDSSERAAKDLDSALNEAEKAIREKKYGESSNLYASELILLALAVRGRTQVAARFVS
jgi:hypothetical protein